MAWRTLLVASEGSMKIRDSQLVLAGEAGEYTVALEEMAVVVFDGPAASVSTKVLAGLCENGAAALFCDAKHMPAGLMLPFHQHTRQTMSAHLQAGWSEPFKKRLWQGVVRQKIRNQAACLEAAEAEGGKALAKMAVEVSSGDQGNTEARAAQYYWKRLLGPDFRRAGWRNPNPGRANAALNYGYAVVRAAVARSLVAHGFLPCFGLHHESDLNAYNLADDLLEPYRPFIDREVVRLGETWEEGGTELSKGDRSALAAMGGRQVRIGGESHALIRSCDVVAQSLQRATQAKNAALLLLPEFAEG